MINLIKVIKVINLIKCIKVMKVIKVMNGKKVMKVINEIKTQQNFSEYPTTHIWEPLFFVIILLKTCGYSEEHDSKSLSCIRRRTASASYSTSAPGGVWAQQSTGIAKGR